MIPEWRGHIQKRRDGSEIVNYDNPDFPSYIYNGCIFPGASWERNIHFHDDIEMLAVKDSDMSYSVNGETIPLHPGDCLFVNSRQLHYSIATSDGDSHYIIFVFHPSILHTSAQLVTNYIEPVTCNMSLPYILFRKGTPDTAELYDTLSKLPDSPLNQFEITTGAFRIWSIILRHSAAQLARTIRNDSIVKAAAIKDMLSFITDNYAQQITLADIAAAGKVSKAYCNRLFHKFTNRTPMENLTRYRLLMVSGMLSDPKYSLAQIAGLTGFASVSYMSERFRETYGTSPGKVRRGETDYRDGLSYRMFSTLSIDNTIYRQIVSLRYLEFYEKFGSGIDAVFDEREKSALFYVCFSRDKVVGCIRLNFMPDHLRLSQFTVSHDYRCIGIGRHLLTLCEREAVAYGLYTVRLNAQVTALGFYSQFGYIPEDRKHPSPKTGILHQEMYKRLETDGNGA